MTRTLGSAALAALIIIAGCSSAGRTNTVSEADPRATPTFITDERFINDPGLEDKVGLVNLVEGEAPGGFRQIQAELFNDTGKFRTVQYSYRWYKADGLEIQSNLSQWKTVGVQPGDFARITGTAPTTDAVDFRLALRRER